MATYARRPFGWDQALFPFPPLRLRSDQDAKRAKARNVTAFSTYGPNYRGESVAGVSEWAKEEQKDGTYDPDQEMSHASSLGKRMRKGEDCQHVFDALLHQGTPSKRQRGPLGVVIKAEMGDGGFAVASTADYRNRGEPKVAIKGKDVNLLAAEALAKGCADLKRAVDDQQLVPTQATRWGVQHVQSAVDTQRQKLTREGQLDPNGIPFAKALASAAVEAAGELQAANPQELRGFRGPTAQEQLGMDEVAMGRWAFLAAYAAEFKANPPLAESSAL